MTAAKEEIYHIQHARTCRARRTSLSFRFSHPDSLASRYVERLKMNCGQPTLPPALVLPPDGREVASALGKTVDSSDKVARTVGNVTLDIARPEGAWKKTRYRKTRYRKTRSKSKRGEEKGDGRAKQRVKRECFD